MSNQHDRGPALTDRLGLKRHRTRNLHRLHARTATKLLTLAAGVWLNHSTRAAAARTA